MVLKRVKLKYNIGLRPEVTVKPGRLPFKHDPHKRLQKYQQEWAKKTIPGESLHKTLRWKVRNDINKPANTVIQFIHKDQIRPGKRKEWKP